MTFGDDFADFVFFFWSNRHQTRPGFFTTKKDNRFEREKKTKESRVLGRPFEKRTAPK